MVLIWGCRSPQGDIGGVESKAYVVQESSSLVGPMEEGEIDELSQGQMANDELRKIIDYKSQGNCKTKPEDSDLKTYAYVWDQLEVQELCWYGFPLPTQMLQLRYKQCCLRQ